jgi:hypothetical protein
MNMKKACEYINDFLYFVIRPAEDRARGALICCSGVNIDRFAPLTKGRHGLSSNPAIRGLQIVKLEVKTLALSKGASPKTIRGNDCAGIAPTKDTWYTEILLIEDAAESLPAEIMNYSVTRLLESIFKACMLEPRLPAKLPEPGELQELIEARCREYAR